MLLLSCVVSARYLSTAIPRVLILQVILCELPSPEARPSFEQLLDLITALKPRHCPVASTCQGDTEHRQCRCNCSGGFHIDGTAYGVHVGIAKKKMSASGGMLARLFASIMKVISDIGKARCRGKLVLATINHELCVDCGSCFLTCNDCCYQAIQSVVITHFARSLKDLVA